MNKGNMNFSGLASANDQPNFMNNAGHLPFGNSLFLQNPSQSLQFQHSMQSNTKMAQDGSGQKGLGATVFKYQGMRPQDQNSEVYNSSSAASQFA